MLLSFTEDHPSEFPRFKLIGNKCLFFFVRLFIFLIDNCSLGKCVLFSFGIDQASYDLICFRLTKCSELLAFWANVVGQSLLSYFTFLCLYPPTVLLHFKFQLRFPNYTFNINEFLSVNPNHTYPYREAASYNMFLPT